MAVVFPLAHIAAVVLGCVYLAAVVFEQQTVKYLLKPTVTMLIAYPVDSSTYPGIFYGLVQSAIGDSILMVPDERMFVPGLVSFLAAHVCYTASFAARWRAAWPGVPLAAAATAMVVQLWPGVEREPGVVQAGVVAYVCAIVAMAYRAVLGGNRVLVAGALLFCVSDALLAWGKFMQAHAWTEPAVMLTYYAAQLCIAGAHIWPQRSKTERQ
ncbi:hypothetical protein LPJ63_003258 [Coemansia sp. RSA 2711]|nr:hypothetical protein LPJ63_003258 [Coemansia sp. RSA 2711]KAJ2390369.1 hypothetical protein H4S02_001901 [Coemansia sp. RSA 2611]